MFLISDAFAQANVGSGLDTFASFIPIIFIFVIFYFLLIRPKQQEFKKHNAMVDSLARGDEVVTGGGILGLISKVDENSGLLHVEIAPDVKIRINRSTVVEVLKKKGADENKRDNKNNKK